MSTYDYDTAEYLGVATDSLIERSLAAGPTGAVPAVRLDSGDWDFVWPADVEARRRTGDDVRTVYVQD